MKTAITLRRDLVTKQFDCGMSRAGSVLEFSLVIEAWFYLWQCHLTADTWLPGMKMAQLWCGISQAVAVSRLWWATPHVYGHLLSGWNSCSLNDLKEIFDLSNLFWLPFGLPQLWRFTSCIWICWLHRKTVGRDSKHKSAKNRRKVSFHQNEKLTHLLSFYLLLLEVLGDFISYVLYQQNWKYKQTQIIEDSPNQVDSSLLIAGKNSDF